MPRMDGKPTLSEAVLGSLTEELRPLRMIHRARLTAMGRPEAYPSGSAATLVMLHHYLARGQVALEIKDGVRYYKLRKSDLPKDGAKSS